MPRTAQPIPDLVRDSEIEATVYDNYTIQVIHRVGQSARQRVIEECWVRAGCLGRGAYGTVYKERCDEPPPSRVRAVKKIKKSILAGEEIDQTRELEAIAKFSHPKYAHCFVRSDGWFESADAVFITMEYLEHGDLQRYLTRPLPEEEAKDITSQVLEGLRHMHDNRFIHRDLKPGNIMVVKEGPAWWVKIADFGISKRRHELTTLQTRQRGTFAFAAPEAVGFQSEEHGSHATALDMWSLGAVAFRIMTNTGAFPNFKELADYCSGRQAFPVARLKEHGISDHGQDFVKSLMSLKPEERPLVDQACQHPWIRIGNGSDVMSYGEATPRLSNTSMIMNPVSSSEPSASWSYSDRIEVTIGPQLERPRPISNYRSPYVEDCSDESDDETPTNISPANDSLMEPNIAPYETYATLYPSNQTPVQMNNPTNQARGPNGTQSGEAGAESRWREFPVVIFQGKDTSRVSLDSQCETLPDADSDYIITGNPDKESDTGVDDVFIVEDAVRDRYPKGKGRRVSVDEPPSWDRAYWKYIGQLEEAIAYIDKTRKTDAQTCREVFDQSPDSFYLELPPADEQPRVRRNRRRSIYA